MPACCGGTLGIDTDRCCLAVRRTPVSDVLAVGRRTQPVASPETAMPNSDAPSISDIAAESSTFDPDPDGSETPPGADPGDPAEGVFWRGILFPLERQSGDGMMFATPSELRVRPLPLPLTYQERTGPGHDGAVVVGRITNVWIAQVDDEATGEAMTVVMGEGDLDTRDETASEVRRKLEDGYAGWLSVETDATVAEERLDDTGAEAMMVATDYRIMGASLVSQPAFAEARIALASELLGDSVHQPDTAAEAAEQDGAAGQLDLAPQDDDPDVGDGGLTAAVVGDVDLPWAPRDQRWDAAQARTRILEWSGGDPDQLRRAFLWRSEADDADPATLEAYRLPVADVIDGELRLVYAGLSAAAGAVSGSRGNRLQVPDEERPRLRGRVAQLYERAAEEFDDSRIRPPWSRSDRAAAGTLVQQPDAAIPASALLAAGGPSAPPSTWFTNPELSGPTALTVDDDGRVYGHLAAWGTCHTGYPGSCVQPPQSGSGYQFFHVGALRTCDEQDLPVGTLVVGTNHPDGSYSASGAMEYYANTGAAVAAVRAGEDEHGIWVAGSVLPGVTEEQIATLRRSPLSGDWRVIAGRYELVAALAVNTPGFPIPRARVASGVDGAPWSLVAAGVLHPSTVSSEPSGGDAETAGRQVAGGPDPEALMRTLATEIVRLAQQQPTGHDVAANDASSAAEEPEGNAAASGAVLSSRTRSARAKLARSRLATMAR